MTGNVWHLLTGEYPPQAGGVADYAAQVAGGLAASGSEVHVWTSSPGDLAEVTQVHVHRIAGRWSKSDLMRLGERLDTFAGPRRLLVQHAPNAWGYRGLNLPFCRWLLHRKQRQGDQIRVMFHEVAYPWQVADKPTRWILAAGHRLMARTLLQAATDVDVTTPAWERMLRKLDSNDRRIIHWQPVPSNIPVIDDPEAVAALRRRFAPGGEAILASFSTFSTLSGPILANTLPRLLEDRRDRVGLLIGQGGDRFAARLVDRHPELRGRLQATGALSPAEISTHLQASDLAVQVYRDGLTTRRTSLMAALANGVATVANTGHLTEPFWAETGAVGVAADVVDVADRLLNDPTERERLELAGRALYERQFALERTIEALNGTAVGVAS